MGANSKYSKVLQFEVCQDCTFVLQCQNEGNTTQVTKVIPLIVKPMYSEFPLFGLTKLLDFFKFSHPIQVFWMPVTSIF